MSSPSTDLQKPLTETQLLQLAAMVEKNSEHPLGEAIVKKATEQKIEVTDPEFFNSIPGLGVEVDYKGTHVLLGNRKLMQTNNIPVESLEAKMTALEEAGKTAMLIAVNQEAVGLIAVADTLKEHSAEAIETLQKMGLEVIMITGDNQRTANAIARQAGVNRVLSEVLPDQKAIRDQAAAIRGQSCRHGWRRSK